MLVAEYLLRTRNIQPLVKMRHIRQVTHRSSSPPIRIRPMICSNWVTIRPKGMRAARR